MEDKLKIFNSIFPYYLPTMVVCIAAFVVIFQRWRQAREASTWAVLGFGLALLLCFVMPIAQVVIQTYVFHGGHQGDRMWAFRILSFFASIAHGAIYALLLVAIYIGRKRPEVVAESVSPTQ